MWNFSNHWRSCTSLFVPADFGVPRIHIHLKSVFFHDVVERNPVHSSRSHHDSLHLSLFQPSCQTTEVGSETLKPPYSVHVPVRPKRLRSGLRYPHQSRQHRDERPPALGSRIAIGELILCVLFGSATVSRSHHLLLHEKDRVRPGDERLRIFPTGSKRSVGRTALCHHASDRQYRSQAVNRAQKRLRHVGLSCRTGPRLVCQISRLTTSFWAPVPGRRRSPRC